MAIDAIVFDLGGVMIDYVGVEDLAEWLPPSHTPAAIRTRLSRCAQTQAFGVGRLDRDEFAQRFVADWGLDLTPADFLCRFRRSVRGWLPGAEDLLAELRPRYTLAALSNTNALHWERVIDDLGAGSRFDLVIPSHEVGLSKPDSRIFDLTLARLNLIPENVAFFDDSAVNVEAARAVGLQAWQVEGVDEARCRLVEAGLL
jgi:putative hydrolase of the HAD superfamily